MKIPENANPYRVIVNGVEHAYEAGEETTVAPGVEELINAADNFPPTAEEVKPPFAGGGGGGGVFTIAGTGAGGVLTLNKTFSEIFEAAKAGSFCVIDFHFDGTASYMYISNVILLNNQGGQNSGNGIINAFYLADPTAGTLKAVKFNADTPSDYPSSTRL